MKDKGIEISPKYGANPTMPICFWCGKDTGDIALLGRIKKKGIGGSDVEAPRHMVLNYEPCENCKSMFNQGVLIAEVYTSDKWKSSKYGKADPDRPEITKGAVPTGAHVVIREGVFSDAKAGDIRLMIADEFQETFGNMLESDDTEGGVKE